MMAETPPTTETWPWCIAHNRPGDHPQATQCLDGVVLGEPCDIRPSFVVPKDAPHIDYRRTPDGRLASAFPHPDDAPPGMYVLVEGWKP